MTMLQAQPIGDLLKTWRQRRRMSQLDLASEAEISTRHLSFIETGRAQPSREMVLHLAHQLEVPLREQNILLVAAGFAPVFPERSLDHPALEVAMEAIHLILAGHEPYPAIAINRHWELVASNNAIKVLLAGIDPALLQPPINVLRLSLHPNGFAPNIINLAEWRAHLLARVRHQIQLTADPVLVELLAELSQYPIPAHPVSENAHLNVAIPFQYRLDGEVLSFIGTTMIFGTPIDVTLAELAIESFFPVNAATTEFMRRRQI